MPVNDLQCSGRLVKGVQKGESAKWASASGPRHLPLRMSLAENKQKIRLE